MPIGVPLWVLRDSTERAQILATDLACFAGEPAELAAQLTALGAWPPRAPLALNPFEDGRSGARIAAAVARFL